MGRLWLNIIVLMVVLIDTANAVEYHLSVTPERFEKNSTVQVDFSLKLQPGKKARLVSLKTRNPDHTLFNSNGCNITTDLFKVVLKICDNEKMKYKIEIESLATALTLFIEAPDQTPSVSSDFHTSYYEKPTSIQVIGFHPKYRVGSEVDINCEFVGGKFNFGYFWWSKVDPNTNETKRLPANARFKQILLKKHKNKAPNYAVQYSLMWQAEPGDEGHYRCKAEYDPKSVGKFESKDVFINVEYPPQIVPNSDYVYRHFADVGENVTLMVNIVANPPISSFVWRRGREKIPNALRQYLNGTTNYTNIISIHNESSYGFYELVITNQVGIGRVFFRVSPKRKPVDAWFIVSILLIIVIVALVILCLVIFIKMKRDQTDPTSLNNRLPVVKNDYKGEENEAFDKCDDGKQQETNVDTPDCDDECEYEEYEEVPDISHRRLPPLPPLPKEEISVEVEKKAPSLSDIIAKQGAQNNRVPQSTKSSGIPIPPKLPDKPLPKDLPDEIPGVDPPDIPPHANQSGNVSKLLNQFQTPAPKLPMKAPMSKVSKPVMELNEDEEGYMEMRAQRPVRK